MEEIHTAAGSLLITSTQAGANRLCAPAKRQRLVNSENICEKTDKEINLKKLAIEKISQLSKIKEDTYAEVGLKLPVMNLVRNKK